jgi:pSer/pThr/pTyr-binding forkhead associated (FHA) protein
MAYLIINQPGHDAYRLELSRTLTIGRSFECDVALDDAALSRKHCRIEPASRHATNWVVVDLKSRNGTRVRGNPVSQRQLEDEDAIQIGDVRIVFHAAGFVARRPQAPAPVDHSEVSQGLAESAAIEASLPTPMPRLSAPYRPPPEPEFDQLAETQALPTVGRTLPFARPAAEPQLEAPPTPTPTENSRLRYVLFALVVLLMLILFYWYWHR